MLQLRLHLFPTALAAKVQLPLPKSRVVAVLPKSGDRIGNAVRSNSEAPNFCCFFEQSC